MILSLVDNILMEGIYFFLNLSYVIVVYLGFFYDNNVIYAVENLLMRADMKRR